MSGKNLFISIINPAVKVIQIVKRTGAVDKYFCKFSINNLVILKIKLTYLFNEVKQLFLNQKQLTHH